MKYLLAMAFILLSGCSFKSPVNKWQYDSTIAFNSYKKDFLSDNEILANNDYKRALQHAKQSADLTQLGSVYFGKCALNKAVGVEDQCTEFLQINSVVDNAVLDAYFSFLNNALKPQKIDLLDKHYRNFALSLLNKHYGDANRDILKMDDPVSKQIAASLLLEHLETTTIDDVIAANSFAGYKRSVLYWLGVKLKRLSGDEREKILKTIETMQTK